MEYPKGYIHPTWKTIWPWLRAEDQQEILIALRTGHTYGARPAIQVALDDIRTRNIQEKSKTLNQIFGDNGRLIPFEKGPPQTFIGRSNYLSLKLVRTSKEELEVLGEAELLVKKITKLLKKRKERR